MECSRCYEHFDIDNMTEVDIYFLCEDCFRLWEDARGDIEDYSLTRMMKFWRLEGDPLTIGE